MTSYCNMFVAVCLMGTASILMAADVQPNAKSVTQPVTQPVTQNTKPAASQDDVNAVTATNESQQARPLQATIRNVKGIVQYRTGDDQPWQKVEEGQLLDIGVEFRTGPRSSVTFHLPPDQLVTLDRLGTLKLLDALNSEDKTQATTELGMRYGRTRYQVEGAQGVEHHATIRSPSATLAIRGTQDVTLTDQRPGRASAISRKTRVYFRSSGSPTQVVFGSNDDDSTQGVSEGDASPGEQLNRVRVVDPGASQARSDRELQLFNAYELYNGTPFNNQGILRINSNAGGMQLPTIPDNDCGCGDNNQGGR